MADEYKIGLSVEINETSLTELNTQIKGLRGKLDKIPIELDVSSIDKQLASIKAKIEALGNIKINLGSGITQSTNGIQRSIQTTMNTVQKSVQTTANTITKSLRDGFANALNSTIPQGRMSGLLDESQIQKAAQTYFTETNKIGEVTTRVYRNSRSEINSFVLDIKNTNGVIESLRYNLEALKDEQGGKKTGVQYSFRSATGTDNNIRLTEEALRKAEQAQKAYEAQLEKSNATAIKYNATLESIRSKYTDSNAAKSIQDESHLESLNAQYQKVQQAISALATADKSSFDVLKANADSEIAKLKSLVIEYQNAEYAANQLAAKPISVIKQNELTALDQLEAKLKLSGVDASQLSTSISDLRTQLNNVSDKKSLGEYLNTLSTVKTELGALSAQARVAKADLKLADARTALGNDIDVWLQQNSAAAKTFGARLQEIKAQIQSADATQLQHLKREFQGVTKQAQLAGVAGKTFGDQFKQSLKTVTSYFSAAMLITRAISVMRNMYNEVLKVDTAMTGLRRVTNLTGEQYQKMYDDMTESAKKYGATLTDIIDLTTSWVKLGFDSNVSARLAEITTMYQHVADLDTSTATENLVSTFKGFQKSLDESMGGDVAKEVEYIADVFDKLNNEYAVTAADVGAALQRSAASLQFANNTLQESSGLVVGMNEILQNAEKTGTILNTTALRLMGAKGKLEELGEEVDENIESITKLQTHVLNLTHGKVNIFNDDKSFKSTYQILKEIAAVYEELSDVEAADLLETIAGKRNANGIAAVLQNWKQVESAMQSATTASGTASAENQKYMESLAGKIEATRAAWQALANSFLSSDSLKGLIDTGNSLFSILDSIVSKTGALPPLLAIIFGYLSASKNIGRDKKFSLNSSNMPIVVIVLFGYKQFRYCRLLKYNMVKEV